MSTFSDYRLQQVGMFKPFWTNPFHYGCYDSSTQLTGFFTILHRKGKDDAYPCNRYHQKNNTSFI